MAAILIASLQAGEGRTTIAAGLGALLAAEGRSVRHVRIESEGSADAVSEQGAEAAARDAEASGELCMVDAPPGIPTELAGRLSARVVLVTSRTDSPRLDELSAAHDTLRDSLLGVVATRLPERRLSAARTAIEERGLTCLAALPEDRLLAGPTVREMSEALQASPLFENGDADEAVEFVMLGPISADPGQPYFLQHGRKAVVNRFDKMDQHLAALATEPDCLILTGGKQPSPYLLDRVQGSGLEITVLLAPEGSVRTVEVLDELYGHTRFQGARKLERASALVREHADSKQLAEALR